MSEPSPQRSWFRWRVIPVVFLLAFGATAVFMAGDNVAQALNAARQDRVLWFAIQGLGGAIWLASAAFCWRGRWWWFAGCAVLGYVLGLAGQIGLGRWQPFG